MELRGHTEVLSLFDLAQVLSVNEATGMLSVVAADDERGWLYFQGGTIINAMDADHAEGEDAAKRVFSLRRAEYSFAPDLPSVAHRIDCGTQSLVMEIARQLDEEGLDDGGEGSIPDRLIEVQQATAALNEIFSRLDTESKILSHRSPQGWSVGDLLDPVRDTPAAVLYLRPDCAPEIRAGGRMIPVSDSPLDSESYESLRGHMLREAHGGVQLPEEPTEGVLSLGEEGCWRIEVARGPGTEVMTIRRIADADSLPDALPWAPEDVDRFLAAPGSLALLVSPDGDALDRAFVATVDRYLRTTGGPVVGMARAWPPGLGGGRAGAVLIGRLNEREMERAPELVDRIEPALIAVDDCDCRRGVGMALAATKRGARALLGICTPSLAFAAHRLLDSVPEVERGRMVAQLGYGLQGILAVNAAWPVPGHAWTIEEEARHALLARDAQPLALALARMEAEAARD